MALEGTIKDFGLPDIFQLIGLQRKTGMLSLNNGQETVAVTFENGMVVMADSSGKRLEDRLGNVLVKQAKLGRERLEEALATQRATLQRLGHILVTQNMITQSDLREALQVQISQIVFKVFRWRDGEYHFAPAEVVDYDRENFTPMSADFILMEGIRMVDEWPIIEKKIPSLDIVFRAAVDPGLIEVGGDESEAAPDGKRGATSKIRLTSEEERIFRRVDGQRTVQAVIDATGAGEFEVCRTLFDLLGRSIISPVGRGAATEVLRAGEEPATGPTLPGKILLAVVVVFALGSSLLRLGTPFALVGRAAFLEGTYRAVLRYIDRSRLERIDRGVLAYHYTQGRAPETLSDVVRADLLDGGTLRDPWARPYHYTLAGNGYSLSSDDVAQPAIVRTLPALQ
jgi:Domain of unknown function (DUF4388)